GVLEAADPSRAGRRQCANRANSERGLGAEVAHWGRDGPDSQKRLQFAKVSGNRRELRAWAPPGKAEGLEPGAAYSCSFSDTLFGSEHFERCPNKAPPVPPAQAPPPSTPKTPGRWVCYSQCAAVS